MNIRILNHPNLDSNNDFLELKSTLSRFHEDRLKPVHRQVMHRGRSLRWKDRLYNSLQCLMAELTYTHDSDKQQELLDKVMNWYRTKTKDRSELPKISHTPSPARRVSQFLSNRSALTPEPKSPVSAHIPKPLKIPQDSSEARYQRFREKERLELKSTEARKKLMNTWSRAKSRSVAERSRIMDFKMRTPEHSAVHDSSPGTDKSTLVLDFRVDTPEIQDKRSEFSKIDLIRRANKDLIDIETKARTFNQKPNSLVNVYKKNFIISSPLPSSFRDKYEEVMVSKNKLAAKKVSCSIEKLETGILLPEMPLVASITKEHLPRGGERLLSSPFPKNAKKGKRGKKGKKKK